MNPASSRPARTLVHAALLAACTVTLLPLLWLLLSSFKTNDAFLTSLALPMKDSGGIDGSQLTLEHYRALFRDLDFARPLVNSVFLSSMTAFLGTLCSAMGGYSLARFQFRGRRAVTALVLGAVLIPGPLLLAPGYELLYHLGLLNSFAGLVLPACAQAFGVFLFRQAVLAGVPTELIEAARLDGCGEFRLFAEVVLPLVKPMIATFVMLTFLGMWNNFITPQVVLQSESKFPLSVAVAQLRGTYYQNYGLQMAGTVISILPVLGLFLSLQKSFVGGLTAGAVKS